MKLFLTGAAGYIGGSVAKALLADGHHIRGLTREPAKAAELAAMGIEPVLGSLDDSELLRQEASRSDAVINAAHSDHAGAARALLAGLEGSGKPLLHTSGSSVIGDDARGTRGPMQVFDDDLPSRVHPAKQPRRDIELTVQAAAARGVSRDIRSVVICPSLIYGTGQGLHRHSVQIPFLATCARESGRVPIVGAGLNVWSHVHIDDLVNLYRLALAGAPAGAYYFVENGSDRWVDIASALAQRLGLEGVQALEPEVAAQRWGEARAYFSFGSNSRVTARRARLELGWSPVHASLLEWIASTPALDASPSPTIDPS